MKLSHIKAAGRAAIALAATVIVICAGGCSEVHQVVDALLGVPVTVSVSQAQTRLVESGPTFGGSVPLEKAARGPWRVAAVPKGETTENRPASAGGDVGKKRAPGIGIKAEPSGGAQPVKTDGRSIDRVPLAKPEGPSVPTECPPSEPLCRYSYSQLKLVGVMQVGEGFLKGMVEDPEGRGYFVAPGAQIAGATVTQVTSRGMLIHIHKTNQDREVFLYRSGKESEDY